MKPSMHRCAASTFLALAALVLQAIPVAGQSADDGSPEIRFEGYLFRDADGRPLPIQTDRAIESFLATSTLVSMKKIPVGVSDPKKLLLAGEGLRVNAVFKDIDDTQTKVRDGNRFYLKWRDWYGYDVAAYRIDRLLQLNRVPPVVEREIKKRKGSVQIWLQGVITDTMRRDEGYKPPDIGRFNQQKDIMHVFDNLMANRDSNLGNTLIDSNWRLWFIDCSRCFGASTDLLNPEAVTHCERSLFEALKALEQSDVEERAGSFLTGVEIKALLSRRDKIVDRIEQLIAEFGDVHILFDTIAPSETAPWARD